MLLRLVQHEGFGWPGLPLLPLHHLPAEHGRASDHHQQGVLGAGPGLRPHWGQGLLRQLAQRPGMELLDGLSHSGQYPPIIGYRAKFGEQTWTYG